MARQKATDLDEFILTPQQEAAVVLLASGKNISDTAAALEVSRQAVSGWANRNSAFIAALNLRRQELWSEVVDSLRCLIPQAIEVLENELKGKDPLAAAVHVLKASGIYGASEPSGPTDPQVVQNEQNKLKSIRTIEGLTYFHG